MSENAIKKDIQFTRIFFYIAYTLLLLKIICGEAKFIEDIGEYITLIELILLGISIIIHIKAYSKNEIIIMGVISSILLYSYTITKNSNIIILYSFLLAMKNIDFEKFIKYDIKVKILFLILNLVLIYLGFLENKIFYRDNGSVRQTFGFASPNSFGGIIMSICFEYIYLRRNNLNNYMLIGMLIISFVLEITCNSRTAEICIMLLAILLVIFRKKIYLKKIIPYIPIILTAFSLILVYLYGKGCSFALWMDNILSTRLQCAYNFFDTYQVGLFGKEFLKTDVWLGYMNTLDNAYLYLILNHGILIYLVTIIMNIKLLDIAIKNNNRVLVAILIVFSIYGLMERGIFFITYNVFLLCSKDIFLKNQELKEKQYEGIDKYNNTST